MITTWILVILSTGDIVGQYFDVETCVKHMKKYHAPSGCYQITHGRDPK